MPNGSNYPQELAISLRPGSMLVSQVEKSSQSARRTRLFAQYKSVYLTPDSQRYVIASSPIGYFAPVPEGGTSDNHRRRRDLLAGSTLSPHPDDMITAALTCSQTAAAVSHLCRRSSASSIGCRAVNNCARGPMDTSSPITTGAQSITIAS
jgi:hypothetical protein